MIKKAMLFRLFVCFLCTYFFYTMRSAYNPNQKFTIVATTSIIADAIKNIVGNCATVHCLMGPGIDPHLYRARESDVHTLAHADIIFYNGLHLEGKMGHVLKGMNRFTKAIAVSDSLDKSMLRSTDLSKIYDPHVWFDVSLWIIIVHYIQQQLMVADPDNAHIYRVNGDRYLKQLMSLHEHIIKKVSYINEHQRVLITAHDAFGYFGRAYGFTVIGLQGLSTDADISTKDIQQLADYIVAHKVRTIFVESAIPARSLLAVQYAVASRGWTVELGDELYADALSDSPDADTYCGMIMHNVDTIIAALC